MPRWKDACMGTFNWEAAEAGAAGLKYPARNGFPQAGPATNTSGGVEFTWYVQVSPTCQVGVPIDEACGVFPPVGEPRFAGFAGPKATAATASPTNVTVTATIPRGLIRISDPPLRGRRTTPGVFGNY